jgi:hypothetical protein
VTFCFFSRPARMIPAKTRYQRPPKLFSKRRPRNVPVSLPARITREGYHDHSSRGNLVGEGNLETPASLC